MKKSAAYPGSLVLWVSLLLLVIWVPVQAQEQNLLTNPGFEAPFTTRDGIPPRQVAQGWTPWHIGGGQSTSENIQPEYYPASDVTNGLGIPRIRNGSDAQQYFTFFATHDGGLYQRVTNITNGATLRFSTYIYAWSSSFDDVNLSENDGGIVIQVGIDPTGGTSGESQNIIWSAPTIQYDTYNEYTVTATASGSAVTVFIRSTASLPVKNNNIYVDDASLTVGGTTSPVASNTPVTAATTPSTSTPLPTATPQATSTQEIVATSTSDDLGIIPTNTAEPLPTTATTTPTFTQQPSETQQASTSTALPPTATFTETLIVPSATFTLVPTATPTFTNVPETATPVSPTATTVTTNTPVGPTATPTLTVGGTPVSNEFPGTIIHTVRAGDTVSDLATLYGSSINAIIGVNGLNGNGFIQIGQRLIIPVRIGPPVTSTPTATPLVSIVPTATPVGANPIPPVTNPPATTVYTVQSGDTLLRIAARFSTTVTAIAQLNGITNVNLIRAGQQLLIPSGQQSIPEPQPNPNPQPVTTYIVRPGDTLFRIGLRFGVPISRLIQINRISNPNFIFVGQVLVIS